jgi:hypothetical protein
MKILAALFLFTTVSLTPLRADEFSSWEWLVPKPAGNSLLAVTFDGSHFIGVGEHGVILSSTNGTNWHLAYTDTTNRLYGLTVGGGRVLAYGDYGTVLASTNREHWHPVAVTTNTVRAVAYGNERYVLMDFGKQLFVSPDVAQWETVDLPLQDNHGAMDMAFGDGLFVAVGWRGFLATSTNGVDWVRRESGTEGPIWAVAYGDGKWVAVGGEQTTGFILTSFDAITWFLQVTDHPLYDVTFGPFGFLAVGGPAPGSGTSLNSGDGLYFSGGEPGGSGLDQRPNSVACGNGVCVAVGGGGRLWTTEDGTNWVLQTSGPLAGGWRFATDGAKLVAAGAEGTLLVSENGLDFEDRTVDENEHFMNVIHTGTLFVAVGSYGVVRTSADGADWVREETGTNAMFKAAAHGAGRTVVVGWNATGKPYGLFAVREEHGAWQIIRPAENEFINTSIAFGHGRFVAAGYYGDLWTSEDGLTWEKFNAGVNQTIYPIKFINGRFIGFTSSAIGQSHDGLNWDFTPGNPPNTVELVYGNGVYVAAGQNQGGIQVSPDVINWTTRPMKTFNQSAAVYFKDSFYVAGYILKSVSSLVPEITQFERGDGELNFHLFGRIGRDYELQSSGNLTDWEHEADYTQSARHHPLTLPTGPDQRFYRVKLKEP